MQRGLPPLRDLDELNEKNQVKKRVVSLSRVIIAMGYQRKKSIPKTKNRLLMRAKEIWPCRHEQKQ